MGCVCSRGSWTDQLDYVGDLLMTTLKEQLLELAKRCEAGDDCELDKDIAMLFGRWNCNISLDAVATLEKELLPDNWTVEVRIAARNNPYIDKGYCTFIYHYKEDECGDMQLHCIQATAPTEPLARLAVLLKALAEMEGE